ncbi:hypothetical protein GEMRC1_001752 [Eukaryota sp. GEM-RC1]
MGAHKDRFPPLSTADINISSIVAVIISHFHLDHIGALPILPSLMRSAVPIFMTHPTKAIAPLILEDLIKVSMRASGSTITSSQVEHALSRVKPVSFYQTVTVSDVSFTLYPAGHILGAAMVYLECAGTSIFYTGDFTPLPDRHLCPSIPLHLKTDILISEATAMTVPRINTADRDHSFLSIIHNTVSNGGKVLVPSTGLGRMQEICITVDNYWNNNDIDIPVFFSTGLSSHADVPYSHYGSWLSFQQSLKYKKVTPFSWTAVSANQPCVVFAAPAMLQGGTALELFKRWAGDAKNTVILPGYCVSNTLAAKVLNGDVTSIEIDGVVVPINCKIAQLEFSAHSDGLGLNRLIKGLKPKNLVLVHSERKKMAILRQHLKSSKYSNDVPRIYTPSTGEIIVFNVPQLVKVDIDRKLFDNCGGVRNFSNLNVFKFGVLYHADGSTKILDWHSIRNTDVLSHCTKFFVTCATGTMIKVDSDINKAVLFRTIRSSLNMFFSETQDYDDPNIIYSNGKQDGQLIYVTYVETGSGESFVRVLCGSFVKSHLSMVSGVVQNAVDQTKGNSCFDFDFFSHIPSFEKSVTPWPDFVSF